MRSETTSYKRNCGKKKRIYRGGGGGLVGGHMRGHNGRRTSHGMDGSASTPQPCVAAHCLISFADCTRDVSPMWSRCVFMKRILCDVFSLAVAAAVAAVGTCATTHVKTRVSAASHPTLPGSSGVSESQNVPLDTTVTLSCLRNTPFKTRNTPFKTRNTP